MTMVQQLYTRAPLLVVLRYTGIPSTRTLNELLFFFRAKRLCTVVVLCAQTRAQQ